MEHICAYIYFRIPVDGRDDCKNRLDCEKNNKYIELCSPFKKPGGLGGMPYMWFQGDRASPVKCGCDFVNKITPEQTTANEKGWHVFKPYDITQIATVPSEVRSTRIIYLNTAVHKNFYYY